MRDKYIYVKEHKVLLEYVDNIGYEPILYEAEEVDGQFQGKIVSDNKMLSTWLIFLRKMRVEYDLSGKKVYKNLYYNQHSLAINVLIDIQECNNSSWMICTGRQFGE
jgi:hypothetical protein